MGGVKIKIKVKLSLAEAEVEAALGNIVFNFPHIIFIHCLKIVRLAVKHAVLVWNLGLSKKQSYEIERIQKVALKIILGRMSTH